MEGEHVLEFLKAMQKGLETQMTEIMADQNAWLMEMKKGRRELMACQETTEANPETTMSCLETTEACRSSKDLSPEEMESEVERRKVPTEEAAVKSSRAMKKRHRGRRMAAGRRKKPKELTRRDCGSQWLLAAASRKVSRHATVAWRERHVSR
jgi:hypothetical protein